MSKYLYRKKSAPVSSTKIGPIKVNPLPKNKYGFPEFAPSSLQKFRRGKCNQELEQAAKIFIRMIEDSEEIYLLEWEGYGVPEGAVLQGKNRITIKMTKGGMVTSAEGKLIANYERLIEYGGAKKNQHQMAICIWPENHRSQ